VPLNPAANFNPALFADLVRGNEIALPNIGRETVHHVHAHDVAEAFVKAMDNRANAVGESFHVVSPGALTLLGYAESVAGWYGKETRIRFLPWDEWRSTVSEKVPEPPGITFPAPPIAVSRRHNGCSVTNHVFGRSKPSARAVFLDFARHWDSRPRLPALPRDE
jgi:nucleoside-diphosphate-sugar epimerase